MKNCELSPELVSRALSWINTRWSQLYQLEKEAGELSIKYLFLTNAGGAVAILGFIGASQSLGAIGAVRIALLLFALGLPS